MASKRRRRSTSASESTIGWNLEERLGGGVQRAACMRPHQRLWPTIRHWLETHKGTQPLPVCSLCGNEVLVRGIDPSPTVSGPFVAPSDADEAAAAEAVNMKMAKLRQNEAARAARAALLHEYLQTEPAEDESKSNEIEVRKWGETEWKQRLQNQAAGSAWDELPRFGLSRAVVFPCGSMLCLRCFMHRMVGMDASERKCPAAPSCEMPAGLSRCGHIEFHLLPAPGDMDSYASAPPTRPIDHVPADACWKCQNLGLAVRVGNTSLELPFGAGFPAVICQADTPVSIAYFAKRDMDSAVALLLAAVMTMGPRGAAMAERMMEPPVRVAVFQGPYGRLRDQGDGAGRGMSLGWRVLPTGFLGKCQLLTGTEV